MANVIVPHLDFDSQVIDSKDPYAPNTNHWVKGDIVLHYADQKHPKMFMVVIGYTRNGLCKTKYVSQKRSRAIWKNDLKNLLNPRDFGFKGNEDEDAYEQVRLWNFYHPIGTLVRVTSADGGFTAKTRSKAWIASQMALVLLEGKQGGWMLKFCEVTAQADAAAGGQEAGWAALGSRVSTKP